MRVTHASVLGGLFAVALTMAVGLAAMPATAETLRIGVPVPLSGITARVGDEASKVAEWWARKVREEHGLDVEVIVRDTSFRPADAIAAVERLVLEDNVSALAGIWHSAQGIAVVPLTQRLKVPLVLMGASAVNVLHGTETSQAKEFAWRPSIDDRIKGHLVGDFMISVVAPKFERVPRVFYIGEDTDFAKDFLDSTRAYIDEHGEGIMENVGTTLYFQPNTPTLISELARVRADTPDVVVTAPSGGIMGVFTNEFRQLGIPALDIGYAGEVAAQEYVELTGENRWGTTFYVYTTPGKPMTSLTLDWEAEFAAEIPEYSVPAGYSAMLWEALETVRHAYEIAGSTDPEAINAAIPQVSFEGVRNRVVAYDPETHDGIEMYVAMAQYQPGAPGLGFHVVYPPHVAEEEFFMPEWVRP